MIKRSFLDSLLYHTKNYQGTITSEKASAQQLELYHTKNYQGTITGFHRKGDQCELYHTKNYQGTITDNFSPFDER